MSHKKFGPDRFSRFDVYWIQTNRQTDKQTDRQAKFIHRFWIFLIMTVIKIVSFLFVLHIAHKRRRYLRMQDFMFITTWTDDLNTNLFLSSCNLSETSSQTNKSSQKEVMLPFKSEILPRKFGVNITVYLHKMEINAWSQIQNTQVIVSRKRKENRKFLKRFYVLQTLCTI